MNKRDRRAVAISVFFIIIVTIFLIGGEPVVPMVVILLLAAYWGYRFTKGDISFIKSSDE
jgi:hypothetical protein